MADSPLERLSSVADSIQPNERPLLVVVVGPTAVGKTRWAIDMARALETEIINADSRQVFKRMAIGTAAPSANERAEIQHHFVDFIEPDRRYSAGQFEQDASVWLDHWFKHRRTAVLAGGSGLYVKALIEGLDDIPSDPSIRAQLNQRWELHGLAPLIEELAQLDPAHLSKMDAQNPQRVIRALEVCLISGRPFSSFHKLAPRARPYDTWVVGLQMDRDSLNSRINMRVEHMIEAGLEAEVRELEYLKDANALRTVGYREWWPFFENECSLTDVQAQIQLRTRQFAKRQMTWFQKMEGVQWFNASDRENIAEGLRVECEKRSWHLAHPIPHSEPHRDE